MGISVGGSAYGTAGAVTTTVPLTIAGWAYPTSVSSNQVIASVGFAGSTNHYHAIRFSSSNKAEVFSRDTGNGTATGTTTIAVNTLYHVAGAFAATNVRGIYLNGTLEATDNTTIDPTGEDTTCVGARPNGGLGFTGYIYEVGFWDVELTPGEIAALANGFSPLFIRRANLLAYYPLLSNESPLRDYGGAYNLTHNGTISAVNHVNTMYPAGQFIGAPAAAVGGSSILPFFNYYAR